MTHREVLAALRVSAWLVLLSFTVGVLVAIGVSSVQTPLYTSSTQLFVSTTDSTSTSDVYQGGQFSQERVTSYARLITGAELAGRVIDELGLPLSPAELQREITATPVPEAVLIDVSVDDPSPDRAQQIAESIGTQFARLVSDLESTAQQGGSPVTVSVTDQAQVPGAASSPNTKRNVAFGAFVGLAAGVAAAIVRARLDRSVKTPAVASRLGGAAVIGTVLRDDGLAAGHVIERDPRSRAAEDYRQLRTNLHFLGGDQPPRVLLVSSALASEGRTTVAISLASTLADAGRQVVLVEADLRRPRVAEHLGLVGGPGLTNILAATADAEEVIQTYREGLSVITAGPIPPNPGEVLMSPHMVALLDKLRAQCDYVLIDTPPLLSFADASALAPATDGVLLAVRYGGTDEDQLAEAAARLERVGAKTIGVVFNAVPARWPEGARDHDQA